MLKRTVLAATAAFLLAVPSLAAAQTYSPVDTPGPPLSAPQSSLDASLVCSVPDLTGVTPAPVLLVHGTSLTAQHNFGWNWIPALDALNQEWCTVELPLSAMGDIQVAGEYVVNAIRKMSADYAGKVDVLGYSQGGMLPRWALRFWPDTRAMVDDLVGIAPSNHGTTAPGGDPDQLRAFCAAVGCAPAFWQQFANSAFILALNSVQETFPGIDYTVIYSEADGTVQPNATDNGSSSLRPGDTASIRNVSVQDVCAAPSPLPNRTHEEVGTLSNPAYLLAVEALGTPGTADETPLTEAECAADMPGYDDATQEDDKDAAVAYSQQTQTNAAKVFVEPTVACYAIPPCPQSVGPGPTGPTGKRAAALKKCKKKKRKAKAKCKKKAKKLPV